MSTKVSDTGKFWLATGLCAAGVALLFTGVFVTAGAILGIDAVYSKKWTEILKEVMNGEKEKESSN